MRWLHWLLARLFGWRPDTTTQAATCLHPNPPGFTACNRYGYATCLTCKAKIRC